MKLSDALILDARLAGETVKRSIAGQVEFWAMLGRAIEPLLEGDRVAALCRNAVARPLSEIVASIDSPEGRRRVAEFLQMRPYPHFEGHPSVPGLLIKIDEDGTRTAGRFVNRQFKAVESADLQAGSRGGRELNRAPKEKKAAVRQGVRAAARLHSNAPKGAAGTPRKQGSGAKRKAAV